MHTALLALAAALVVSACTVVPVPLRAPYHLADADLTVTRIVHASVLVELRDTRFLVDPWFHSGFVVRQREPLGLTPDRLPPLAAVLVTHGHGDHFDVRSLRELASAVPLVIGPRALGRRLADLGIRRVVTLDRWESTRVDGVTVTAVPALHAVPENGYVLEAGGVSAYLAGDTRSFPELTEIAARFPDLDAALLPVGGERLLGLRRELTPADAASVAATLGARRFIPIGYGRRGGFPFRWYARRPKGAFVDACRRRGIGRERIVILQPGESWHYYASPRDSTPAPGRPSSELDDDVAGAVDAHGVDEADHPLAERHDD